MNHADPGRNLLFSLLAFQNQFIDRRALLATFAACTSDKSKPLDSALVEQGALTEPVQDLINGLLSAHLARHDNEPDKSLAEAKSLAQARGWLRAELSAWNLLVTISEGINKQYFVKNPAHWKQDPDLVGMRDLKELAKLPEADRKKWQALWADVDKLLEQAKK